MAPTNPSPTTKNPRGSFRSRLGQINPAFAAAHGISPVKSPGPSKTREPVDHFESGKKRIPELPISPPPVQQAQKKKETGTNYHAIQIVAKARTSGKLQASDSGLETPLPKMLFDFSSLADTMDISLDTNPDKLKPWESHVAESLLFVDFSDNEGITEFPALDNTGTNHESTNSVERYRSVHTFRARRCMLEKFPVTTTMKESWSQLVTLDLSGNRLSGEFSLMYLPQTIRNLDLSGNKLTSLKSSNNPSISVDLPQLICLDCSNNDLAATGIPPIMHVKNLQKLFLSSNNLYNLNFILKSISSSEKSLTTLNLAKCMLSDLDGEQPFDFTAFVELQSLDMSGNALCSICKIPPKLQRLNVNENEIRSLEGLLEEDQSGGLKSSSLAVLQIQRNKLSDLDPLTISKLIQLARLDLQNNSIKHLPVELGSLINLQQMFLDGNHLLSLRSSGIRGDLNDTKAILTRLRNRGSRGNSETSPDRTLHKQHSSLSSDSASSDHQYHSSPLGGRSITGKAVRHTTLINVEVGRMLDSVLIGTKAIDYSKKRVSALPGQLLEEIKSSSPDIVHGIERLDVSRNQLQGIDDEWLASLPQLRTLDAHDNHLLTLPSNVTEFSLTNLDLSQNNLAARAIQSSILLDVSCNSLLCGSLQVLNLSGNNLDFLPVGLLQHFKSLKNLNLSRNRLTTLKNIVDDPIGVSSPCLEHLNLNENRIEDMGGDDFALMLAVGCPKLQSLKLENNELQRVPMTLGLLENLKILDLRGNPQRLIRYDILDKSTTYVLQYMRNRMTSKTKQRAMQRMQELAGISDGSNVEHSDHQGETTPKEESRQSPSTSRAADSPKPGSSKLGQTSKKTPGKSTSVSPAPASPQGRVSSAKPKSILSPMAAGRVTKLPAGNKAIKDSSSSTLLEDLEKSIQELADELDRPGLSEPKRYAIKKKLAMERSRRLREERRLKQEKNRSSRNSFSSDPCVALMR